MAEQIITAPLMVKGCPDVCYDSPVDGRPITSWQARQEDLKRNHCRPYDPEMQKDAARFRKERDEAIDKSVDAMVEEKFEKMSTKQRGKLASEVLEQGTELDVVRSSPTT